MARMITAPVKAARESLTAILASTGTLAIAAVPIFQPFGTATRVVVTREDVNDCSEAENDADQASHDEAGPASPGPASPGPPSPGRVPRYCGASSPSVLGRRHGADRKGG